MPQINGWIFDVYADEQGMAVWVIDTAGVAQLLRDSLAPAFFVFGAHSDLHEVCVMLSKARLPVRLRRAERHDLFLRRDLILLEVQVLRPCLFAPIFSRVRAFKPALTYYNADLAPAQFYYFAKGLFPLAACEVQIDARGWIKNIEARDSPWDLEYKLPALKMMSLRIAGASKNPRAGMRGELEVEIEDRSYVLEPSDPRELLVSFGKLLQRYDPDVLVSEYGDSYILPQLLRLAKRYDIPLPLNRDPRQAPLFKQAYSYTSYGRVVYRSAAQILFGRWHIDLYNAFRMGDYWLDGIFELSRLTGLNVQKVARTSTGTGISAIEAATAYRRNILIPYHKREAEDFKSAGDLILTDKGGLTYRPMVGLHENVAEIDFISMYPFIMAKWNISPETINCPCCHNPVVPEIGYSICTRHKGLIPETLEPLVAKRVRYKLGAQKLAAGALQETYRQRAQAIKGLLVTCFGYTGYKNARFGKIEAHEAINAYGRAALIHAKEIVESHGFEVLHLLIDSLWITKSGAADDEYPPLLAEITAQTGLPIALEGIYNWITFLPARENKKIGVPNRYFGVFREGKIKTRGIELRRGDTAPWIKAVQQQAIELLAAARNRKEFLDQVPHVVELIADSLARLRSRQVACGELALTYRLTRDPQEYRHNTLNALVAQELTRHGVSLHPGEAIHYIITDAQARNPHARAQASELIDSACEYDVEKYAELLLRAMETILQPAGLNRKQIERRLAQTQTQPAAWQLPLEWFTPIKQPSRSSRV